MTNALINSALTIQVHITPERLAEMRDVFYTSVLEAVTTVVPYNFMSELFANNEEREWQYAHRKTTHIGHVGQVHVLEVRNRFSDECVLIAYDHADRVTMYHAIFAMLGARADVKLLNEFLFKMSAELQYKVCEVYEKVKTCDLVAELTEANHEPAERPLNPDGLTVASIVGFVIICIAAFIYAVMWYFSETLI